MARQPQSPKFLKSTRNGRVFQFTDALFKRGDMLLCDSSGNVIQGQVTANLEGEGTLVRKAKFIGIPRTRRLFPWTAVLAARSDAVPIDSIKQWDQYCKDLPAEESAPVVDEVDTDNVPEAKPVEVKEPGYTDAAANELPDIEGMGKRDAKTTLSYWAEQYHGGHLDRSVSLENMIEHCQSLIDGQGKTANSAAG